MRKDDYDQFSKPTQAVSCAKHSPLGVLYRACLSFFAAFLAACPPENLDKVEFIYERGPKEGGRQAIQGGFQRTDLPDWFGPLKFVAKADRFALQAADCLAASALFNERVEHAAEPSDIGESSLVKVGSTPATLATPRSSDYQLPARS